MVHSQDLLSEYKQLAERWGILEKFQAIYLGEGLESISQHEAERLKHMGIYTPGKTNPSEFRKAQLRMYGVGEKLRTIYDLLNEEKQQELEDAQESIDEAVGELEEVIVEASTVMEKPAPEEITNSIRRIAEAGQE